MLRHLFAAAVSVALIVTPAVSVAQAPQTSATQPEKPAAKKKVPAGLAAARERQKKCGAEWKDAKAGGTVAKDMTWPKFWSACNKRLKAQPT